MEPLTSAKKKQLRGVAQRLRPQVHVGRNGLSAGLINEIETALVKDGLVKVRFETDRSSLKEFCDQIPAQLDCEYIGGVGKTGLFFRERVDEV